MEYEPLLYVHIFSKRHLPLDPLDMLSIFRTSLLNRISTQNPLRHPLKVQIPYVWTLTFCFVEFFVPQLIGIDKIQRQARIDKKVPKHNEFF